MASRLKIGKSFTDGFIREGGNPKSVKRFVAVQMVVDIAEDEFTFTPGIGGYDDAVSLVKANSNGFELLECCGV